MSKSTPAISGVAAYIKSQRDSLNLTQDDVAAQAGIKQSRVSVLESGRAVVRLEDLAALAPVLRLDLEHCAALQRAEAA